MDKLAEIHARRQARRDAAAEKRQAQELADFEAIDALEAETGEILHTLKTERYVDGLPTVIAYRAPKSAEYKRYASMLGQAAKKDDPAARLKAQELLADACWSYPQPEEKDLRKAIVESFPGTLLSIAVEAPKLAEQQKEEEGKG